MRNIVFVTLASLLICCFNNGTAQTKGGWEILFDGKDLSKWQSLKEEDAPVEGWKIEDNVLSIIPLETGRGKGRDLMTKTKYEDFELVWSFKLTKGANTGVKYLLDNIKNTKGKSSWIGLEYQLIDDENYPGPAESKTPEGLTGALYLVYPANENKKFAPQDWNTAKIVKKGNAVEHWLNGKKILSYQLGSNEFVNKVKETKFKEYPDFAVGGSGYILIQDHGDTAYFKDIKIRALK